MKKKQNLMIFIGGAIIGIIGALLMHFGNPGNMGICVACFFRDIAGALGLHGAKGVQYIRPEIIGFILGAFIISMATGEFRAKGGSNPALRFVYGFLMMIGALVFLGCPLRMLLRIGAGDLNAVVGLLGFIGGILVGIVFIKKGYSLGRNHDQSKLSGLIMPIFAVILLVLALAKPMFINFSAKGPGSMHAPFAMSLCAGLIVGAILQRTRLCTAAGFRDAVLIKDYHFLYGIIGIVLANAVLNMALGQFKLGFAEQLIAHSEHLWNFLSMSLVGLTAVLLGGCPIRQTILASQGDTDAFMTVIGLICGAAASHNFNLASSGKGTTPSGRVAVIVGLVLVAIAACYIIAERKKGAHNGK